MEIARFARGSTRRQQQTQTIDQQRDRLRAHGAQHSAWQLAAAHSYRADGSSAATLKRPGRDRLRDHAACAAFEQVRISAPDRRARTDVHQRLRIDELAPRGGQVVVRDRPMSADPHDQLRRQIRGAVAAYARTLIADRPRRAAHAGMWPVADVYRLRWN